MILFKNRGDIITDQEKVNFINYYKHNPADFIEDYMGIKLLPYQKAILKVFNYTDEINLRFNPAKYSKPFSNIAIEQCIQDMKDDFQIQKEKGILVKTIKK